MTHPHPGQLEPATMATVGQVFCWFLITGGTALVLLALALWKIDPPSRRDHNLWTVVVVALLMIALGIRAQLGLP